VELLKREWMAVNGLGGYACGTVAGVATRKYILRAFSAPSGSHETQKGDQNGITYWM
jgi:hypothetical protein